MLAYLLRISLIRLLGSSFTDLVLAHQLAGMADGEDEDGICFDPVEDAIGAVDQLAHAAVLELRCDASALGEVGEAPGGAKFRKAQQLGVPMLDEAHLLALIASAGADAPEDGDLSDGL